MALTPTRRASSLKQVSPSTPVYQTTQANSSQFGGLEAKANVGAAGSAARDAQVTERAATQLAQANAALGQSIYTGASKIFDVVHQKTLDDEKREVQQQMNRFSEGSRGILSSLNQLSGEEYVNASAQARDDLADLRQEISATSTTQRSQGNFLGMSGVKAGSIYDSMSQNYIRQNNKYKMDVNNATIKLAEQNSAELTDPEQIVDEFTRGYDAARSTDKIEGRLSPESRQVTVNEIGNKVVGNAIRGALARGDIRTATAIFNGTGEYEGIPTLTGKIRTDIAKLVKVGNDADKIAHNSIDIIGKWLSNGKADLPEAKKELNKRLKEGSINGTQYKEILGNLRRANTDSKGEINAAKNQGIMDDIRSKDKNLSNAEIISGHDARVEAILSKTKGDPVARDQLLKQNDNYLAARRTAQKIRDQELTSDAIKAVSGGTPIMQLLKNNPELREALGRDHAMFTVLLSMQGTQNRSDTTNAEAQVFAKPTPQELKLFSALENRAISNPSSFIGVDAKRWIHALTREHYEKVLGYIKRANDQASKRANGDISDTVLKKMVADTIAIGVGRYRKKEIRTSFLGQGQVGIAKQAQLNVEVALWYDDEVQRTGKPPSKKDINSQIQLLAMKSRTRVDLENTGIGMGSWRRPGKADESLTIGMEAIGQLKSHRARAKATVPYDTLNPGFKRNILKVLKAHKKTLTKKQFSELAGTEVARNWVLDNIRTLEKAIAGSNSIEEKKKFIKNIKEWEAEEREHEIRRDNILKMKLGYRTGEN